MSCNKNLLYILITVVSIAVGITYGYFYATSIIEAITSILWSAFAIALFATLILLGIILFNRKETNQCVCRDGFFLLFGIIGTLIFSEISLAVTINTTLIAVLVGITAFFTVFTILSLAKMIACLIQSICRCQNY